MYDVITMGSASVDVFVKTDCELIDIKSNTSERELIAYPLGSKILVKDLQFMIGGGGTNTAVSFSRLGLKTAYLGCIGNDDNGNKIIDLLEEEHVDFIGSKIKALSNYSVILDSIESDRTILTYRDASNKLQFENIDMRNLKTKWMYASSLTDESFTTLEHIACYAHEHNSKFAFNASSYLTKKGIKFIRNLLTKTDVLILNKEEAMMLVGSGAEEYLLETLSWYGPDIVVVTSGKYGVSALIDNKIYTASAKRVLVKETTGAGDAFASGFVAGLIMNRDPKFCLLLGMNNAESVVQSYGAKNVLLTKEAALKRVEDDDRVFTCYDFDKSQSVYNEKI